MVFRCDGVLYDSGALVEWRTGDPHTPLVYATPDYGRVSVAEVTRWAGVDVWRVAAGVEVESLAERFGLEELRRGMRDE